MFWTALATIVVLFSNAMAQTNYTETLSGLASSTKKLDMVYVQGGTFKMGCDGSPTPACGPNETPVRNVTVSDYYISKYEVTRGQWKAIIGSVPDAYGATDDHPIATIDWYRAVEFVCELNKKTGKSYRLATEAEWEFAAKGGKQSKGTRFSGNATAGDVAWTSENAGSNSYMAKAVGGKTANELGIYDMSGNVREWVYDAWAQSYPSADQTNPTGAPTIHIQKIRRGGGFMTPSNEATVTARKIRSIEGADGDVGFRLAISSNQNSIPTGMTAACDIHKPPISYGKGTLRDDRLITGNDYVWVNETSYQGQTFISMLKIWEDGTAVMKPSYGSNVSGEWATGNDFSLYIMNSSGTRTKYIYYVVSPKMEITLMPNNDMPNRWEWRSAAEVSGASSITKPSAGTRTPEQIVPAGSVVDMSNPPTSGKDSRLIVAKNLGSDSAWLQDNVALGAGGTHRYRFDYTSDTTRFVVYDVGMNTSVIISTGKWFTIDNTFLRITGSNGRKYDYLYSVSTDGKKHYHISFQGYERGDFRMFDKVSTSAIPNWKEPTMEPYATNDNGGSTYLPPNEAPSSPSSSSIDGSSSSSDEGDNTYILSQIAIANQAIQVKNGINLQVMKDATVEIYNIRGKLINKQKYASGIYSISYSHLPKGMYIVKVRFGKTAKVLRVPIT